MLTTIENLREIARLCRGGEPLNEDLARWLSTALELFLRREVPTIECAMGLRAPRGGVPWWLEEAMRRRDAALRDLAQTLCPDLAPSAQARRIFTLALRYAASAWRHDQLHESMPAHYQGKPHAPLWRAFKAGAPMPICERQLRKLLAR
jgi:hypothetical protein